MDIYVNDIKIDFTLELPLSWKDFFHKLLAENHVKGSHSIVELTVDGVDSLQVITSGWSDEMVPGNSREVRINTEDSKVVAGKALGKIFLLIENMKTEIVSAAILYREEKIKEASEKIAAIMEAFRSVVQFVNSVGVGFSIDFETVMYDDTLSLGEKMESFLETFSDIVKVQREKDYEKMAGYLQNRLLEDMAAWNRIVTIILEKVEGRRRTPEERK